MQIPAFPAPLESWLRLVLVYGITAIGASVAFWHWLIKPIKRSQRAHKRAAVRRINGIGKRIEALRDEIGRATELATSCRRDLDRIQDTQPFREREFAETKALLDTTVLEVDKLQLEIGTLTAEVRNCVEEYRRNNGA